MSSELISLAIQEGFSGCGLLVEVMSKKLIEFLVHFSEFSYNVIACFYAEICTIYQISIYAEIISSYSGALVLQFAPDTLYTFVALALMVIY